MLKKGMIIPQSLLGIILGAVILALILLPITFGILKWFEPQKDVCTNPKEFDKIQQVLNQGQERTIAWHQEGLCRLVAFTPTQQTNFKPDTQWQKKIAQGGSWICLCKVEVINLRAAKHMLVETAKAEFLSKDPNFTQVPLHCQVQECTEIEGITKINDQPFSTWGLPQETFLTFKKEATTLYINKPQQEEATTKEPL